MLEPKGLKKWVIFYPTNDRPKVDNFLVTLRNMGRELGIEMVDPLDK